MSAVSPARRGAYAVVRAVTSGRSDLPDALARERRHVADARDQALMAEIAAGTIRWQAALDAAIASCAERSTARLDPEVLDILRLSAYQILHLDRIPTRSAVAEGVELVRLAGKHSASGLANAVLRRLACESDRLPLPPRPTAPWPREAAIAYLATTLSHPVWLVERWLDRLGFEAAESWARFNNRPPPLTLRANTLRGSRRTLSDRLRTHGVETTPTAYAPDGLVVVEGNPLTTPLSESGDFLVQDEASQLVALMVDALPGQTVLDACAAPGGKTVALAGAMQDRGVLVAGDRRPRRVALLHRTIRYCGVTAARPVRLDAAAGLPFGAVFDRVLVDAPCSGLGTIRRDPEIRWRRQPPHLVLLAETQHAMLVQAARTVGPGGRLVYATCSSEPEENEEVVERFLSSRADFEVVRPDAGRSELHDLRAVLSTRGFLSTSPHLHGLEAFFAAAFQRHG